MMLFLFETVKHATTHIPSNHETLGHFHEIKSTYRLDL